MEKMADSDKEAEVPKDIDQILPLIGELGRYQILLILFFCVMFIPLVLPVLVTFFVAHNPGWRCVANNTVCPFNETQFPAVSPNYEARCSMPRNAWKFALPEDYSIVTQFDLYCGNEGLILLTTSIFFVGAGTGAFIMGLVSDRFGRKTVLFPSLFVVMTLTCLSALSPNIYVFIVSRFLVGFFTSAAIIAVYVIATELVGIRHRPLSGSVLWISFCLALSLLGVKAYFVRKWKVLLLICTLPYYFLFLFFKFVPESVRWLRVRDRIEEAETILYKVARFNKKNVSKLTISRLDQSQLQHKGRLKDIFWPRGMLIRTLVQSFGWFACGMVYYGVTLASDDLGGSMYRDYILSSLAEVPAVFIAIHLCNRYGRKVGCNPALFFTSFVLISIAMVPASSGLKTIRVFFGLVGKLCISISFAAIYTWSVELYPTSIRSVAMGLFQITSRIGAASAPWVAKWLRTYQTWLPFAVMGGVSLAAGIVLHWLPETRNKPTAETLEDILTVDSTSEMSDEKGELMKYPHGATSL